MTFSSCPQCNSKNTSVIVYGYMLMTKELKKDLEQKRVVLGGCCVTENDPQLMCNDCLNRW